MPFILPYLIAALFFSGAVGFAGYRWADHFGRVNLMQCEQDHLKAVNESNQKARENIARAYQASDKAILAAMQQAEAAQAKTEEISHELKKHTTNRPCLSSNARGVLHTAPAFKRNAMPKHTGSALESNPGTAENSGDNDSTVSTDDDVAAWIATATQRYEECRTRVDAIAQWDREKNGRH